MLRTVLTCFGLFVLALLLVVASFGGGYLVGGRVLHPDTSGSSASRSVLPLSPSAVNDGAPSEFQPSMPLFWEAWDIVQSDFYKQPVDSTKMSYGAISGMVDALGDPHTAFVDAQTAQYLNQELQGSFEGIGAEVEMRDGRLTIIAPIKDTPADKAGLKPGDVILQVDNTLIQNMDVMQAIKLIRGPKGSSVKLVVQRSNQAPFTLTLVRDTIKTLYVESKMLDTNIAYVKLNEFSATAPQQLHEQLQALMAQHPKALIFDLRSNPGGFLDASVKIASEFIKEGSVVLVEKFKNGDKQEYKTEAGGVATAIPMVLLVNDGSASASEILSGAIKDYHRAEIIGTTTYGKGSVQSPHELSDKSQLRVTIAHFFSPQEHEINGVGIKPDIQVPDPTDAEVTQGKDPQLDRAVQYITSGARLDWNWILDLLFPTRVQLAVG